MATKVIDEKKRFSYVVTFGLFDQTNVNIRDEKFNSKECVIVK